MTRCKTCGDRLHGWADRSRSYGTSMDFQVWLAPLLSLVVAVVAALLIGRFFTPSLESRKVAAVAASEESETFAQHLHLMAVDFRLAQKYEERALQNVDGEENVAKIFGMLEGIAKRATKPPRLPVQESASGSQRSAAISPAS